MNKFKRVDESLFGDVKTSMRVFSFVADWFIVNLFLVWKEMYKNKMKKVQLCNMNLFIFFFFKVLHLAKT